MGSCQCIRRPWPWRRRWNRMSAPAWLFAEPASTLMCAARPVVVSLALGCLPSRWVGRVHVRPGLLRERVAARRTVLRETFSNRGYPRDFVHNLLFCRQRRPGNGRVRKAAGFLKFPFHSSVSKTRLRAIVQHAGPASLRAALGKDGIVLLPRYGPNQFRRTYSSLWMS